MILVSQTFVALVSCLHKPLLSRAVPLSILKGWERATHKMGELPWGWYPMNKLDHPSGASDVTYQNNLTQFLAHSAIRIISR